MYVLTVHQPRATLIAAGIKTRETRSWRPPEHLIGQRIGIHAGKVVWGPDRVDHAEDEAMTGLYGTLWELECPTGQIIAIGGPGVGGRDDRASA